MAKLVSQFYAKADAGKFFREYLCYMCCDMKLLWLLAFDVGIGCCASAIVYLYIPVAAGLI